ncbi:chymotrypsinogen A-like isoform X2 [Mercenaria mercenaria]|uniref:chymotrypsinogen A-like isoform X2 n=1 Tax=Mercenaria mercenaria TaxID=6596 RepID=UPI001E1D416F|nr:chymotrypsinogen A-like isoform X2 [Mercenaria mercenaria]
MRIVILISLMAAAHAQQTVQCGVPVVQPKTSRIVGGTVAVPGSWPWMTLIADSFGFISGSGAIIDSNVVLTSAQHFEGVGYSVFDLNLHNWRLYAGEYNIKTQDPHEKSYHIRRVVLHPGYNTTSLENDIALIITVEPIMWNDHTRPACIADGGHTYTVGTQCYLPGWGSTETTGNEEVLNQLNYPILDDSVCANHWTDFLPYTEICAGYENQLKDFCGDDIGSPLMCKDQSGAWYVTGIASSGGNCTTADEPGIFEDVTMYTDWIKKTMEEAGYPYQF